jgi:hypothetical protein
MFVVNAVKGHVSPWIVASINGSRRVVNWLMVLLELALARVVLSVLLGDRRQGWNRLVVGLATRSIGFWKRMMTGWSLGRLIRRRMCRLLSINSKISIKTSTKINSCLSR